MTNMCKLIHNSSHLSETHVIATNGSKADPGSFFEQDLCIHPAAFLIIHLSHRQQTSQHLHSVETGQVRIIIFPILPIMYFIDTSHFTFYHGCEERHKKKHYLCKTCEICHRKYGKATKSMNGPNIKDAVMDLDKHTTFPPTLVNWLSQKKALKYTESFFLLTMFEKGQIMRKFGFV